jgi:hypothetical protein
MAVSTTTVQHQAHTGTDIAKQVQTRSGQTSNRRTGSSNRTSSRGSVAARLAESARTEAQTTAQIEAQQAEEQGEQVTLPHIQRTTQEGGTTTQFQTANIGAHVRIVFRVTRGAGAPVK